MTRSAPGSARSATPEPFRPVVRALLLTGGDPLYLRAELPGTRHRLDRPLWSPAGKIGGRVPGRRRAGPAVTDLV